MRFTKNAVVLTGLATAGTLSVLALMALANRYLAGRAEKANPAQGKFLQVDGERLHFVSHGQGQVVVILHGNGSMVEDWLCSGIISPTKQYRMVAFDRPGYGHSPRPGKPRRTPEDQADLIAEALTSLGIEKAILVGHSWGTLVAVRLAERHPEKVSGLVLLSGYYFATARIDVLLASVGALPLIGTLLCHTVLPILSRIAWPLSVKNLFKPSDVPAKFQAFPRELAVRPAHIRTSAEEAALMLPSTSGLAAACQKLAIPIAIVCGAGDQVVDPSQSSKLHRLVTGSTLRMLLSNGHMVHQTSPAQIIEAIDEVGEHSTRLR